ncbi:MAG: LysR family transcriptional regulator [Armatimonadota bacterium]
MELEALRTFVDLCDSGSFSRTAQRRCITQSAVSQRIRTLEAELGVVLLDRAKGRRELHPTEAGRTVLDASRDILARADRLEIELDAVVPGQPAGLLRVATVYSLGLHSLTTATARFLEEYPRVRLHIEYLRTDRIYDALAIGAVDCGVVACPRERTGVVVWRFADEPMVVVVGPRHPLASGGPWSPSVLDGLTAAVFDPAVPTRALVDRWLESLGVESIAAAGYDNVETMKQLVHLGSHYAVLPEPAVRREVASGELITIELDGPGLSRPIGMIVDSHAVARRELRCFRDVLAESMGAPIAG